RWRPDGDAAAEARSLLRRFGQPVLAHGREVVLVLLQAFGDATAAARHVAAKLLDVPDAAPGEIRDRAPELVDVRLAARREVGLVRLETVLDLADRARRIRAELLDVAQAGRIRPRDGRAYHERPGHDCPLPRHAVPSSSVQWAALGAPVTHSRGHPAG